MQIRFAADRGGVTYGVTAEVADDMTEVRDAAGRTVTAWSTPSDEALRLIITRMGNALFETAKQ